MIVRRSEAFKSTSGQCIGTELFLGLYVDDPKFGLLPPLSMAAPGSLCRVTFGLDVCEDN